MLSTVPCARDSLISRVSLHHFVLAKFASSIRVYCSRESEDVLLKMYICTSLLNGLITPVAYLQMLPDITTCTCHCSLSKPPPPPPHHHHHNQKGLRPTYLPKNKCLELDIAMYNCEEPLFKPLLKIPRSVAHAMVGRKGLNNKDVWCSYLCELLAKQQSCHTFSTIRWLKRSADSTPAEGASSTASTYAPFTILMFVSPAMGASHGDVGGVSGTDDITGVIWPPPPAPRGVEVTGGGATVSGACMVMSSISAGTKTKQAGYFILTPARKKKLSN